MSRSWKKVYGHSDRNPFMKNQASRRIRHLNCDQVVPDGAAYRKYFCSYDICDFKSLDYTESQFLASFNRLFSRGWFGRELEAHNLSFEDIVRRERHKSRSK